MGFLRFTETLRIINIAVFVAVGVFLQPAPAQNGVSDELLQAAENGPVGVLRKGSPASMPVVCAEGSWSQMLGCCAATSGVCVGEGLDQLDQEE